MDIVDSLKSRKIFRTENPRVRERAEELLLAGVPTGQVSKIILNEFRARMTSDNLRMMRNRLPGYEKKPASTKWPDEARTELQELARQGEKTSKEMAEILSPKYRERMGREITKNAVDHQRKKMLTEAAMKPKAHELAVKSERDSAKRIQKGAEKVDWTAEMIRELLLCKKRGITEKKTAKKISKKSGLTVTSKMVNGMTRRLRKIRPLLENDGEKFWKDAKAHFLVHGTLV